MTKKAFSLVELLISFIAISIILTVFMPAITKKESKAVRAVTSHSIFTSPNVFNKNKCEELHGEGCNNCNEKECNGCVDGYLFFKDKTSYSIGDSCLLCESFFDGCVTCEFIENPKCTRCKAGYKLDSNGTCSLCGVGEFSDTDATDCTKCPAETYNDLEGNNICMPCQKGYFSEEHSSYCSHCEEKYSKCIECNKDECLRCDQKCELIDGKCNCPAPILDAKDTWFTKNKYKISKGEVTNIKIVNMHSCGAGENDFTWDASSKDSPYPLIACFKRDSGMLELSAEGVKKIEANTDSSYAFSNFSKLKEISFGPNKNAATITVNGIKHYNNLEVIFDTSKVKNMSYMFYNSGSGGDSTDFNIEGIGRWNTYNVTNMASMFELAGSGAASECSIDDLTKINIQVNNGIEEQMYSPWDTSNVKNMSNMFNSYAYLADEYVKINGIETFNIANVEDTSGMFEKTAYSTKHEFLLNLRNWKFQKVKKASRMFAEAGRQAADNWCLGGADSNGNCYSVALKFENAIDMSYMFYRAGYSAINWKNIEIKIPSSAINLKGMFYEAGFGAKGVWSVSFSDDSDTSNVVDMSYMFYRAGFTTTKNWLVYNLPNATNSIFSLKDASHMFEYSGFNAKSWDIGTLDNWIGYNLRNMDSMFFWAGAGHDISNNENLMISLNLSKLLDRTYVSDYCARQGINKTMHQMFSALGNNASRWNIGDISNWNTTCVIDMSKMFAYAAYNIEHDWPIDDFSKWNTSNVRDMRSMFWNTATHAPSTNYNFVDESGNCSNGSWNTLNVENMETMFAVEFKNNDKEGFSKSDGWKITGLECFNTSKVVDMYMMFTNLGYGQEGFSLCGNNASKECLTNWDVTNVKKFVNMFGGLGCGASSVNKNRPTLWDSQLSDEAKKLVNKAGYSCIPVK